jgi:ABC-type sugar transport system ATPase subunit
VAVSKSFSSVCVLDQVTFQIRSGEVHALLGENGSGKSTLVKVLAGVYAPATGYVHNNGSRIPSGIPHEARRHGLSVVHQDYQLFPDLDVATNIVAVNPHPLRRWLRKVDQRRIRERASQILDSLEVRIDPNRAVRDLAPADRKLIEIARALGEQSTYLILDEATASLDRHDSETILTMIERLTSRGIGVGLVTHRLDEALRIANRITVLRDGKAVASDMSNDIDAQSLAELIVGAEGFERIESDDDRNQGGAPLGMPILELADARLSPSAEPFTLSLHSGEILGVTGLLGSGVSEVAQMLTGHRPLAGRLSIEGRARVITKPSDAIASGIGYVPEDRGRLGLIPDLSVETNISLASLRANCVAGFVRKSSVRLTAQDYAHKLRIRASSLDAPVRSLSGGNQQKVMIAKWLASRVRILVLEAPTHGVDIGAKFEIRRLLKSFVSSGGAVIVCSTDAAEVLALADTVVVLKHGEAIARVGAARTSYGEILVKGASDHRLAEVENLVQDER